MYSVKYSREAYNKIDNFIHSYKKIFKKLYTDTGIDNEDIIIQNYINIGNKLYKNIKNTLENIFQEEFILGKIKNIRKEDCLILSIDRLKLFVFFTENEAKKERYIEDIDFFRK